MTFLRKHLFRTAVVIIAIVFLAGQAFAVDRYDKKKHFQKTKAKPEVSASKEKQGLHTSEEKQGLHNIGGRLELLVDDYLIESMTGEVRLQLHRPERKEIVFRTDAPWEGNASAYQSITYDGRKYHMYYRGGHYGSNPTESGPAAKAIKRDKTWYLCFAESSDGIHWRRPEVGLYKFPWWDSNGSTANNIILHPSTPRNIGISETSVFYDDNPDCPPDERYKITGIGERAGHGLYVMKSTDGIHFAPLSDEPVVTEGEFDSQNLIFWDPTIKAYREYHRIHLRRIEAAIDNISLRQSSVQPGKPSVTLLQEDWENHEEGADISSARGWTGAEGRSGMKVKQDGLFGDRSRAMQMDEAPEWPHAEAVSSYKANAMAIDLKGGNILLEADVAFNRGLLDFFVCAPDGVTTLIGIEAADRKWWFNVGAAVRKSGDDVNVTAMGIAAVTHVKIEIDMANMTATATLTDSTYGTRTLGPTSFDNKKLLHDSGVLISAIHRSTGLPGVATATSKDIRSFPRPVELKFPGSMTEGLYTPLVKPYYRAPHILVGFPMRYTEREWSGPLLALPGLEERLARANSYPPSRPPLRYGRVITDALFMTSRDGVSFKRWPEAFIRPGPRLRESWVYGDNFVFWGMAETRSHLEDAPDEISLYATEGYWEGTSTSVRRYTLRLDGFVSAAASAAGGEFTTRPFLFEGGNLTINFETSGASGVRVEIQQADGTPIEGYTLDDCPEMFADSVRYTVRWNHGGDVRPLEGKPVRLRYVMRDADLYAFQFVPYQPDLVHIAAPEPFDAEGFFMDPDRAKVQH